MEGSVLHFDEIEKKGILRDDEGNRYEFTENDWKSDAKLKAGLAVDFVAENNIATQIFVLKSSGISGDLLEKASQLQESGIGKKLGALFSFGMHNKFGVIATLAVLVSLFFTVIEIPFLGKGSLINGGSGKLIFILLVVVAILFYGGATKLYTRILVGITLGILFFQYYDLFSGLSQANDMFGAFGGRSRNSPNFFQLIQWGALVNIVACMSLFIAAFKKEYSQNENTI